MIEHITETKKVEHENEKRNQKQKRKYQCEMKEDSIAKTKKVEKENEKKKQKQKGKYKCELREDREEKAERGRGKSNMKREEKKKEGNEKLVFRNGNIFSGVWFSKECKREGVLKDKDGNIIREGIFDEK